MLKKLYSKLTNKENENLVKTLTFFYVVFIILILITMLIIRLYRPSETKLNPPTNNYKPPVKMKESIKVRPSYRKVTPREEKQKFRISKLIR